MACKGQPVRWSTSCGSSRSKPGRLGRRPDVRPREDGRESGAFTIRADKSVEERAECDRDDPGVRLQALKGFIDTRFDQSGQRVRVRLRDAAGRKGEPVRPPASCRIDALTPRVVEAGAHGRASYIDGENHGSRCVLHCAMVATSV